MPQGSALGEPHSVSEMGPSSASTTSATEICSGRRVSE